MSKISNVFTMLELLNNGQKYSVDELSRKIEVSKRMIRLYKTELELAGIFIDTIRGPYGGYILNQNVALPHQGFSKYDRDILINVISYLENDDNFKFKKEIQTLIDKVDGVYKSSKLKPASLILEEKTKSDLYNLFNKAIKNNNKVLIQFLSLSNDGSERVIHPCNVFLYNDMFYVAAYCELRNEIRHFEFERILSAKILEEKF